MVRIPIVFAIGCAAILAGSWVFGGLHAVGGAVICLGIISLIVAGVWWVDEAR